MQFEDVYEKTLFILIFKKNLKCAHALEVSHNL